MSPSEREKFIDLHKGGGVLTLRAKNRTYGGTWFCVLHVWGAGKEWSVGKANGTPCLEGGASRLCLLEGVCANAGHGWIVLVVLALEQDLTLLMRLALIKHSARAPPADAVLVHKHRGSHPALAEHTLCKLSVCWWLHHLLLLSPTSQNKI